MAGRGGTERCDIYVIILDMSNRKKRLTLDKQNALVVGVVAGLAKHFSQDTTLFRIVAVAFIILSGVIPGVIIYLLAWFLLAQDSKADYTIDE